MYAPDGLESQYCISVCCCYRGKYQYNTISQTVITNSILAYARSALHAFYYKRNFPLMSVWLDSFKFNMIGGQRCIRCNDLWLLPALVYVMGGATSAVPIRCIEHIVHHTGTGRCGGRARVCALARVFTPARDSGGLEPTLNDAAAEHTGGTWVGRTVSARAGSQSAPRKATTGWRAQPMRHVLRRDNGQWDARKTWARGFPHMLTLVKWREKRARRDTDPWYERSAVRAEAGLGLLLLLLLLTLLLLLRGVCQREGPSISFTLRRLLSSFYIVRGEYLVFISSFCGVFCLMAFWSWQTAACL